jgi:glycerol-3-phosphate acyltransferase PlsY
MIFAVRARQGHSPWEYALYGIICELLLLLALRPNIERLIKGTERLVGFRSRKQKIEHDSGKENQ